MYYVWDSFLFCNCRPRSAIAFPGSILCMDICSALPIRQGAFLFACPLSPIPLPFSNHYNLRRPAMSRLQTITLTARIKLKPASDQAELLRNTMRRYRDACNFVSAYVSQNGLCSRMKLQKILYDDIRAKFELSAQMTISVLRTVYARYKQIQTVERESYKLYRGCKPVKKDKKDVLVHFKKSQIDLLWNRDYSFQKYTISLSTLQGRILVRFDKKGMAQYFDGTWKFGTAKIVTKHGKWYLHIPMTKDVEVPEITEITDGENTVGVDLGINFLAVSYDSHGKTTFWRGGFAKQKRSTYQHVRQSLQKKGTPSARRRLKKIDRREHGWSNDVNHCISKALVQQNPEGTLFV